MARARAASYARASNKTSDFRFHRAIHDRHSGAMRSIEPGIWRFPDAQSRICGLVLTHHPGMTESISSRSRDTTMPGLCEYHPRKNSEGAARPKEGAGKTGCPPHPRPRVQNKKHTSVVATGERGSSGLPCAMVLTAYSALFPVTGLYCHRHPCDARATSIA
jgi:hypothetical protein